MMDMKNRLARLFEDEIGVSAKIVLVERKSLEDEKGSVKSSVVDNR